MGSGSVISLVLIILLLGAVVFITSREEVKTGFELCKTCNNTDDCNEPCKDKCLKKYYDNINSTGLVNKTGVYCMCECKSTIKGFMGDAFGKKG